MQKKKWLVQNVSHVFRKAMHEKSFDKQVHMAMVSWLHMLKFQKFSIILFNPEHNDDSHMIILSPRSN